MGEAEGLAKRAWARLGSRQENQAFVFLLVSPNGMANVPQSIDCTTVASPALARRQSVHTFFHHSSRSLQRLSRPSYHSQPSCSTL